MSMRGLVDKPISAFVVAVGSINHDSKLELEGPAFLNWKAHAEARGRREIHRLFGFRIDQLCRSVRIGLLVYRDRLVRTEPARAPSTLRS